MELRLVVITVHPFRIRPSQRPGTNANILALPVAMVSLLVATWGLAPRPTFGLACGGVEWLRFSVSMSMASRAGRLPRHLPSFLDWAYAAGLLRLSGVAIQFRHRELQDWLKV